MAKQTEYQTGKYVLFLAPDPLIKEDLENLWTNMGYGRADNILWWSPDGVADTDEFGEMSNRKAYPDLAKFLRDLIGNGDCVIVWY